MTIRKLNLFLSAGIANGPISRGVQGVTWEGSSGSTENPTSKKNSIFVSFRPFCIRLTQNFLKKKP